MSKLLRIVTLTLLFLFVGGLVSAQAPTPSLEPEPSLLYPATPLDDPVRIVPETISSFTHGGGFLYWERNCAGSVEPNPTYIRRQAENGTLVQTLYAVGAPTIAQCQSVSRFNVADDDGFFYANPDQNRVEARLTHDPTTPIPIVADLDVSGPILITDENYVYLNKAGGIYRSAKDSLGSLRISDATGVTGLAVDDTYIYWLDAAGLWRSLKTCTSSSCWDNKDQLATVGGQHLTWQDAGHLLWVNHSGGYWKIYRSSFSGGIGSIYTSPDSVTWSIGRPIYHDGCYFWLENTSSDFIPPRNNLLRRMCGGQSTVETIADGLSAPDTLVAAALGVVFGNSTTGAGGLYHVAFDAAAITKDLYLDVMELYFCTF